MASYELFPPDPVAKRKVLLDAVEQIRATLVASADDSEQRATLSPTAVDALDASGILRLKLPASLGGAEADPVTQMEVIEALATIDTASAWCAMVGATSVALLGAFLPEPGVQRVFTNGEAPIAAISIFPAGVAVAMDDGYRVNGRWRFCSGIRHAAWVSVGAVVQHPEQSAAGTGEPPEVRFVALPVPEVTIHDNWQAMGLKGTGSCDISVTDSFVPHELTFQWDMFNPLPQRGGPLYRLPVISFVANEHIGFALGVARRALDELIHQVQRTKGVYRASALQERQIVHRLVGKLDLELSAVRSLAIERYRAAWRQIEAGKQIDGACQAELRSIATYVTDLAVNSATAAYRYGGAGALFQPNTLERLLRDIHAAAQHMLVGDDTYEAHGQYILGLNGANT
ncbi:MAG: hypothetical protein DCC55_40535 [Chloroflexi bacterium]|nr:MAG: hypothetical protein DCC55_40535 [Chloroflexota bacterium]